SRKPGHVRAVLLRLAGSFAPPPCPARTRPRPPTGGRSHGWLPAVRVYLSGSALALLVPGVGADDHDAAVPTDDPALTADLLDARLDLHGAFSTKSDSTITCCYLYRYT